MKRTGAEDTEMSDQRVSNEYRALASETVPEWIDHRILAEAAAAIKGSTPRSGVREWMRPLAFAATAGLCIAVFLDINQEAQIEPPVQTDNRRIMRTPAQTDASQADSGAALSRAVQESGRQLQQLDAAMNGTRPNLPARYCSEEQTASREAWWNCITKLRGSGDQRAAEAEYRLLIAAFPDFRPVE
jgi:hypothetical protein